MSTGSEVVDLETRTIDSARVAVVRLNRPQRLNAMNQAMLLALEQAVHAIRDMEGIQAAIITGAGDRAFCAGAEVEELAHIDARRAYHQMARGQQVLASLEQLPIPTIAAINGYALGGGLELALACDLRVAVRSAYLGQPEIRLGNIPGWGGTQRLPRVIGEARAKDLIYRGRLVSASEAHSIGLVTELCDAGEVLEAAERIVAGMAGYSVLALALAKQAIHASRLGSDLGYELERQSVARCCETPEQAEAVAAFLQGRTIKQGPVHTDNGQLAMESKP